ncbi:MAG: thioredoxin [Rhodocyclaceae bacterium]|nr:thioredoxin [Rhodocyclaceae bacterium]
MKSLAPLLLALAALSCAAEELPSSAPLFAATLSDPEDTPVALEKFRGKPLIVNFWARWCGPCRQEIPALQKLRNAYRKEGLEVIGIGIEDKPEAVREFARAYDMDYPVLLAKEQGIPLMQALGNSKAGLPFTVVIDRQGRMVARKLGLMQAADLAGAAETVLRK